MLKEYILTKEVSLDYFDLLKLSWSFISHKFTQFCLRTNQREIVNTFYGKVRGVKHHTIYGEEFYIFEGIPYAKPPLGKLRFRAPQPPAPWLGVRDCTSWANKPVQLDAIFGIAVGNEDCLYLNVYTKQLKTLKPLPVMVYIHGGYYQYGEASRDVFGPDYFMQQDVVLVNMNYRLGALGFLSLEDPDVDVPGNAGLKDILMALRWIKHNITHFNGDANNITLFGESAGAAAAHYMLLCDKAKGLFHKAILQSGTAFCPWVQAPLKNCWPYRLARELGYTGTQHDKTIFDYLSKTTGKQIIRAASRLNTKAERLEHVLYAFSPVIEPYESESCIISKPIVEVQRNAWSKELPIMLGGTSFEGLLSYPDKKHWPYMIDELGDCELVLPNDVRMAHSAAELREMGLKLKRAYFGKQEPSAKNTFLQYLDLLSYKDFWECINRQLIARLNYAPKTATYLYRFDFDSAYFNHFRLLRCDKGTRGASHSDDISYLFYHILATKLNKDTAEYKTIERMIGMWTAFAATSDPNCAAISPHRWEHVQPKNDIPKCLNISKELKFMNLPEKEKLKLWESFYTKVPLF